uniref:J domain-containing protein n=1 Tax=Capra hircus TaxID=9925 RepID=A0A8C2NWF2_CAPHI
MAARVGVAPAGDGLRYAGSSQPPAQPSDADLDRGLARSLIAVGLGIAALGFAGRYAFQIWKPLGQVITETAKKISTPSFSSYYKGGFEQKMSRREASLILGISPSASKAKIRAAHRRIMILNHPDKGFLCFSFPVHCYLCTLNALLIPRSPRVQSLGIVEGQAEMSVPPFLVLSAKVIP